MEEWLEILKANTPGRIILRYLALKPTNMDDESNRRRREFVQLLYKLNAGEIEESEAAVCMEILNRHLAGCYSGIVEK